MNNFSNWKKTTAFLMAMALVAGAAPVNAAGLFKANSIVANAADDTPAEEPEVYAGQTKKPEVGTLFKVNDTIEITKETWFVVDDDPRAGDARAKIESNLTIKGYTSDDNDNQYVWSTGEEALIPLHYGFYITRKDPSVTPEGFYITSGKGTEDDPFIVGLSVPEFLGKSVTLRDDLSLNFIVDVDSDADADDLKVKLTGDCAEAGFQDVEKKTIGGQEVYCATASVNANKMDSVITAELYYGDSENVLDTLTYSVNEYLTEVDTSSDAALKTLVDATKQYGAVASAYFGNGDLPEVADHKEAVLNDTIQYEIFGRSMTRSKYAPNDECDSVKISLVLNSKLAVRVYSDDFEDEHDAAFDIWTFNPFGITDPEYIKAFKGANDKVCCEIPGITPTQLGTTFNINYLGTDYQFTPLSWAYRVFKADNAPAEDIAMANALYEYYIAASNIA